MHSNYISFSHCYHLKLLHHCCPRLLYSRGPFSHVNSLVFTQVAPLDKPYHNPSSLTGEGNGTPLQYSCLENHMDGGAW